MNTPLSITIRLTLLFAAASSAVLLTLGLVIGTMMERHFEEQDWSLLDGKLQLIRHTLAAIRSPADLDALPNKLNDSLVGHHGLTVAVRNANGESLYATPDAETILRSLNDPAALVESPTARLRVWRNAGNVYRSITEDVEIPLMNSTRVSAILATDISHHTEFMTTFRRTLWMLMFLATALSALLGWIAARFGLAPLRDIVRASHAVSINRLDYRLSLDAIPAELRETARAFNEMLARLEDSFQRLTGFASDLAHELRTPISNLMTQTQVTLAKARSVDDYREILYSNAEEYERLARMISDMLFLAKADHDLMVPQRENVDLEREVRELFDFYDAVSQEQGVGLRLTGSGQVSGDRLMLRRALSNLLSNAIRHTPRGGTVTVGIVLGNNGEIGLSVENPGSDIPPEHLPRVFDRFYRVDPSRQPSGDGAGLGLAITHSITRIHGGRIDAHSAQGVTRFQISLPQHEIKSPDTSD